MISTCEMFPVHPMQSIVYDGRGRHLEFSTVHLHTRAECPPYGQVPAYRKPVSRHLASFELSAQVATEAGCYNDGRV